MPGGHRHALSRRESRPAHYTRLVHFCGAIYLQTFSVAMLGRRPLFEVWRLPATDRTRLLKPFASCRTRRMLALYPAHESQNVPRKSWSLNLKVIPASKFIPQLHATATAVPG